MMARMTGGAGVSRATVTIVIPVFNGAVDLEKCLAGIGASATVPLEVIVVDDGSTDGSRAVVERFGARVLGTGGRCGPAKARNLGAREAKGDVLFFLDADVVAQPDSIGRVVAAFSFDGELDALIGSYDDDPAERDLLSQYKNLMHCYTHQTGDVKASTFWSGCGAIRRDVFVAYSGFDESYARPAIEDIELGYRLSQANRQMVLDKQLRVKHLKRWTFWKLLKTDILDRGIPWTELILRDRNMPNDLNLRVSQRVSVALAFLSVGFALLLTVYWRGYFFTPVFALLLFGMGRYWVDSDGAVRGRHAFLGMTASFVMLVALAWWHHMLGVIPPVVLGYVLPFLRHRYAYAVGVRAKVASLTTVLFAAVSVLMIFTYLPGSTLLAVFILVLISLIVLNNQFYVFLASRRGRAFAVAAVPFHLLYHFCNGISFTAGLMRHSWRSWKRRGAAQAAGR
jgi:glycosyltransferase involved in cell wall biosynthesis